MFTFSLDGYREQASGSPPNGLPVTAPTRRNAQALALDVGTRDNGGRQRDLRNGIHPRAAGH